MQILFASTSYPADDRDWKGVFILRMLEGLCRRDDLQVDAWCPRGPLPDRAGSALQGDDAQWLQGLMARGGLAHLLRSRPVQGLASALGVVRRLRRALSASDADAFHLNWLQNALALPMDGRPVLLTALGTDMQLLRLPLMRRLLQTRFSGRRVVLCPNADWMVPPLQDAFGSAATIKCVPFGIDRAWYHVERDLSTPVAPRWLCVTRLTAGKLGPLFEWAAPHFQAKGRELHLIGPRQQDGIAIPDWVRFHGPATPAQLRETWFPQAAGLVSLSTHPEGRPQVMLEAMAAGLPILASAQAAHEDLIAHRQTGWICRNERNFSEGLAFIESHEGLRMGVNAKEVARERFGDWDDCASRYANLYASLKGPCHGP